MSSATTTISTTELVHSHHHYPLQSPAGTGTSSSLVGVSSSNSNSATTTTTAATATATATAPNTKTLASGTITSATSSSLSSGLVLRLNKKKSGEKAAKNDGGVEDVQIMDRFHDESNIRQNDEDDRKKYDVLNWEKVEPQFYKRKPKNIRRFYKQQNLLIDQLQTFVRKHAAFNKNHGDNIEEEQESLVNSSSQGESTTATQNEPTAVAWAIHGSFALNVALLTAKIVASVLSGSMSVIASTADSLLDLLSGSVLVITHRLMSQKRSQDPFLYPQGKSRLEPIGVFSFAIIMMLSSLQIIIEAIRRLVSRPEIDMGIVTLSILGSTIISKAIAFWYCRKVARQHCSGAAAAYADDHRNDVMTNMVGVGAAVAAVYVPMLWWLDSTGAICIALYIIYCWLQTGHEQMTFLTGRGASPMLLQQLTYIAANHDPRILYVDTVRAYHFGINYLAEIDIVLPEDMALRESHDIGESLQHRIEQLDDVERAFVHNDYEWDHSPVVFKGTSIIRR